MGRKISSVNPYLRDLVARESMVVRSVVTSSAIEGIRAVFKRARSSTQKSAVGKERVKQKKV
jgi:hypothetical protein